MRPRSRPILSNCHSKIPVFDRKAGVSADCLIKAIDDYLTVTGARCMRSITVLEGSR